MINTSTFKYIIVGGVSTAFFLTLLIIQVEFFYFDPVIAAVSSNLIVIIGSYFASYIWVFKSNKSHSYAFIRYASVIGIGFSINTFGMYLCVHVFEFWYIASQVTLFVVVAINNYSLNKLWVFKNN